MLNKKGQISEIMTWIVATLIIVSVLIVFIYASSLLAQKTKILKAKDLKIDTGKEQDLIEVKNNIAYTSALNSDKNIIEVWRENNEKS